MSEVGTVKKIKVADIRTNQEALRTVDRANEQYVRLADSVRTEGVIQPITVAMNTDKATGQDYYSLVDGLQRFSAACDAGHEFINAKIEFEGEDQLKTYRLQLILNNQHVDTKPVEYSKQLIRILKLSPTLTLSELAEDLHCSVSWVQQRLNIIKLPKNVADLVDDGSINLSNAIVLSKLPADEQENFVTQAQTLPTNEFAPLIATHKAALDKARRKDGKDEVQFQPTAYMRKIADVKVENETNAVGAKTIASMRLTSAEDGWRQAILWVLNLDDATVAIARQKHDEHRQQIKDKQELAKKERERRKIAGMETKLERDKLQLQLTDEGKSPEEIEKALAAFDEQHKQQ